MRLATECKLFGAQITIQLALTMRDAWLDRKPRPDFRCIECDQPVRAHCGPGPQGDHFEHLVGNPDCSRSEACHATGKSSTNAGVAVAEPQPVEYGSRGTGNGQPDASSGERGMRRMKPENFAIAKNLAAYHGENEESISEIYLFPSDDEIRLAEVVSDAIPWGEEGQFSAFRFNPDPGRDIPLPTGVALIRPEEARVVPPPDDWGSWDLAQVIWRRGQEG